MIKKGEKLLLLPGRYIVDAGDLLRCKFGAVDTGEVVGKKFGAKVKSSDGTEFTVLKPTFLDLLEKAFRGPQVILPRDAAQILAVTGINKDSIVVDAGSGSGFLAIFLSQFVKEVHTYEKRKEFFEKVERNINYFGIKNIVAKNKDIKKAVEKEVDLVALDLENPEKVIGHAEKMLKKGGWLAVYSPYSEQISAVHREIGKRSFADIKSIETCWRELRILFDKNNKPRTRPKSGEIFTGYWTFARRI